MDRDVYAKLLANLQTLAATKIIPIIITGTIPTAGACSEEVGALADIKGWQWLVETSANIWSDLNQVTYYNNTNNSIYLHLEGTAAGYRGKDYKLIVYKLNQPAAGG